MNSHVGSHGSAISPDASHLIPNAFWSFLIDTMESRAFIRFYRIELPRRSLVAAKPRYDMTPSKIYQFNSASPRSSVSRHIKTVGRINDAATASLQHLFSTSRHQLFGVTMGSCDHETWLKWWSFCWTVYVYLRTFNSPDKNHMPPLYF